MAIAEAPAVCSRTAPTGQRARAPQPSALGPRPWTAGSVGADQATRCSEAGGS
jgi:hypothetical protein